jgi:tetratricopeptide (TPR) repeat protein
MNSPCTSWIVAFLAGALLLGGCQTGHRTAQEEANERWNVARADVKTRLALDQLESGHVAAAASELAEAQRLHPEAEALVPLRARVLLAEGRVAEAAAWLEQADLVGAGQAEALYLLGVAYQQQQQLGDALSAFVEAASLQPDEVAYLIAVAQTWLQLGQPEEALRSLTTNQPRFGWTPAYQAALAEVHEQLGNWAAAAAAWQRVAYADQAGPDLRIRLAEALFMARRYPDATAVLLDVLPTASPAAIPTLRLTLAECLLAQDDAAGAREQARLVLQNDHDNGRALRLLARAWAADERYDRALQAAQHARSLDPRDPLALELVAALAYHTGAHHDATAAAEQLRRHDRDNAVARRILAQPERPALP